MSLVLFFFNVIQKNKRIMLGREQCTYNVIQMVLTFSISL